MRKVSAQTGRAGGTRERARSRDGTRANARAGKTEKDESRVPGRRVATQLNNSRDGNPGMERAGRSAPFRGISKPPRVVSSRGACDDDDDGGAPRLASPRLASPGLPRARRGCPRIRRCQDLPLRATARCRVDVIRRAKEEEDEEGAEEDNDGRDGEENRRRERKREGENEWPYETFSITKSNTANVARRRKNSEDAGVKEPRPTHGVVRPARPAVPLTGSR